MNNDRKPTYRPIVDDGADYTCAECGGKGRSLVFWFIALPNGKTATMHRTCVDPDWIEQATFIPRTLTNYSQIHEQE